MKPIKPAFLATAAIISLFATFPVAAHAASDAARVAGDLRVDGLVFNLDGSNMQTKASPWGFDGAAIYYNVINGKVGIGTAAPTQVLDVSGNANVSGTLSTGSMIVDLPGKNAGSIANTLIFGINSGEGIGSNRNPPIKSAPSENLWGLDFYTNYTKRMSITQAGNVGIGTATPTQMLDVRGNVDVSGSLAVGGNVSINPNSALSFGSNRRQMLNLWENEYGVGIQDFTEYFRTGRDFAWFVGGGHANSAGDPGGGTTMMALTPAGLSVNGTLSSTGKVSAANLPAIKSTQFYGNLRANANGAYTNLSGSRDVDTVSVNVPSDGYLLLTATLDANVFFESPQNNISSVYFKLNETTNPQAGVELIEQQLTLTFYSADPITKTSSTHGTITLHWVMPTGSGTRSFTTSAYAPNAGNHSYAGYGSHTLNVLYIPNSL